MKFTTLVTLASASSLGACQNTWQAPASTDKRSPCPMLNTLANHGYLPRDGLDISMNDLVAGFSDAINLDPAATQTFGAPALLVSTTGNSATFNLHDLAKQGGTLQHDGSLSRADLYFGDVLTFNATVWATASSHFTGTTIDVATARSARAARIAEAQATNPTFNMTAADLRGSGAESALYMTVFAEPGGVSVARTEWVKVLFENERLPIEEGWTKASTAITAAPILALAAQILAA
ncbi:uncharacterized protein L3040_003509 [Drepanopeziza brunnea f. sp. 'multigermtubi']|uniref:Heme haloperoxidase family profile domain-containing protein n=1 Tax=Marssonina brunnea f. sp. multigermtubi (strain MB_m1) TaxID=1072389 RepID=K1WF36_MARBU|nr:uncharacterized protein MBM_06081 [Drepanopeziza brunnea f. sp. 'multigermtubi' MB_m1]EKD16070.1 hypothetical protein MBM_06081 [Drepanopeziza brunnea f. sp. 'multigermtubi' MB_m1]KAJ5047690.1 hypothetical protein L3040_003509 [Drepanopeziza brunnea f. sp. 'multigermtubi']